MIFETTKGKTGMGYAVYHVEKEKVEAVELGNISTAKKVWVDGIHSNIVNMKRLKTIEALYLIS
ncbi:MAG: hypothetical protein PHI32_08855, partial [Dysgonamonadaceae bacterium]|nr:hypothetical protein [Dysgonamonadaceae bacterium]